MINIDWRLQGDCQPSTPSRNKVYANVCKEKWSFLYNYIFKYVSVLPWKNQLMSLNTKSYPHKLRLEEVLEHSQFPRRWCEVWCQSTGFLPTQHAHTLMYPLLPARPVVIAAWRWLLVVMRWSGWWGEGSNQEPHLICVPAYLYPARPTPPRLARDPRVLKDTSDHVSCIYIVCSHYYPLCI